LFICEGAAVVGALPVAQCVGTTVVLIGGHLGRRGFEGGKGRAK
jgi:hypothetical protein